MMKRLVLTGFVCILLLCTAALAQEGGITVTDMLGREISLSQPAKRVVAVSAADCEILCALGCEETLVGRGEYCDYPASIQELPMLQSGAETNIEEILALAPQVVLMSDMAQTTEQIRMLEQNGVKVAVSNADTLADVYTSIRMIGALMGRADAAEGLIAQMQSVFAAIEAQSKSSGKSVYFEVSPLEYGLWAAGRNTFVDEIATMCGLENAFSDVEDWGPISEEQVLMRNPDYIVTISMDFGNGTAPADEICARRGWSAIRAVADGNVFMLDSDAISRPGPRLMDAAIELFCSIYGYAPEGHSPQTLQP